MMEALREIGADRSPSIRGGSEEYICWSRMQAEAGQTLDAIIARKELERRAGKGTFFWGVGNAPATISRVLARLSLPVEVIFSIMKSKAKPADIAPARTVLWNSYIDVNGIEMPLPSNALVTSRGDSASGPKRTHYALMCYSNTPLAITRGLPFDPKAFRNAGGNGAPVGASQVTALLKRVGKPNSVSDYEVNLRARLIGSYWVRLTNPRELSASQVQNVEEVSEGDIDAWMRVVKNLRSSSSMKEEEKPFWNTLI